MKKTLLIVFVAIQLQAHAQNVILQGFFLGPRWNGTYDTNNNPVFNTAYTWGVPCPSDGSSYPPVPTTWFYDEMAKASHIIAQSGFTAIWLPSAYKGVSGSTGDGSTSPTEWGGYYDVGYGSFDQYDLGDKLQAFDNTSANKFNYRTRYGSRAQLARCVAAFRANGINVYHDFVLNQANGANVTPSSGNSWLWIQYPGAAGGTSGGRFSKFTGDFHNPPSGDPAAANPDQHTPAVVYPNNAATGDSEGFFGADFGHINSSGALTTAATELNTWGDWLVKATGVQGYRLDDAVGISWDYLKSFIASGSMSGKFSFAELASIRYGAYDLQTWMKTSMAQTTGNFTMFDFKLEGALHNMCNTDGFWMGAMMPARLCWNDGINGTGTGGTSTNNMSSMTPINPGSLDPYRALTAVDPSQSITVVNEVDSESPAINGFGVQTPPYNANLPTKCLLGYAYIMSIGFGTPSVSYKDWGTDAACYGSTAIDGSTLNNWITNLIWCHRFLISGSTTNEQLSTNGHVYTFQKTGGQQAMVFLNSNQSGTETVTVTTSIANGTQLKDYTGRTATATVTGGQITVTVPANVNGRGYLIMAPTGISGSITPGSSTVTQEWDGNSDLSIPAVPNGTSTKFEVARIWVDQGQLITAKMLNYNVTGWGTGVKLTLEIDKSTAAGTGDVSVATKDFTSTGVNTSLTYTTPSTGGATFYDIYIKGTSLPTTGGPWWFNLQNTYKAPATTSTDDTSTIYH